MRTGKVNYEKIIKEKEDEIQRLYKKIGHLRKYKQLVDIIDNDQYTVTEYPSTETIHPKDQLEIEEIEVEILNSIKGISDSFEKRIVVRRIVKRHIDFHRRSIERLKEEYPEALKGKFPYKWMIRDKQIKEVIDRNSFLIPLLNLCFEYNKNPTDEKVDYMDSLVPPPNDTRHHSVIIADKKFYTKACKELGCSKISVQKYLAAFDKAGIFRRQPKRLNHGVCLYLDGYFTPFTRRNRSIWVKHPLINESNKSMILNFRV